MSATPNIYTIPAGVPFAKALAAKLLKDAGGRPEVLSKMQILLPTRRACRVLRESFLEMSDGQALLLPKMQPLGDVEEEELSLSIAGQQGLEGVLDLPPALSSLRRQLLLTRAIMAMPGFEQGPDHALALAASLGQLMDKIYTENKDLANIGQLVPAEFASHWQITIDFLKILSEHWPKILAENGGIDAADRRNKLILALSAHWKNNPPDHPVIAAGSTGSIPATAELLATISNLPRGQVVLPGFDLDIDPESWESLEESHPQYGFKLLLSRMGAQRDDVKPLDGAQDHPMAQARRALAGEVMRPADSTAQWITLKADRARAALFDAALENLMRFECAHEGEEAQAIALLMRETLETPGATAALVTPDRMLARRVAAACQRWGIALDDSAGQTLDQTALGLFFKLISHVCIDQFSPVGLLTLLKNRYVGQVKSDVLAILEQEALRGPPPEKGLPGITNRLVENKKDVQGAVALISWLETVFEPLVKLAQGHHSLRDFVSAHSTVAEGLAGADVIWRGESGEAAAELFAEMMGESNLIGEMSLQHYSDIVAQLFKTKTVRPAYGTHPRLMILGQLEARLINADLVILGGLNEGTWPPDPGADPWMSRPMRKDFGLPGPERSLGLAAHDFVQGFCAPRVALTRSKKQGGSPSVPARWLQKLDTVLDAAGLPQDKMRAAPHLHWARTLDEHQGEAPFTRPAPTPPVEKRPNTISASRIETWLKDPYSIYARYVLRLKKLDPIAQEVDAARRGSLLHDILERFVSAYPEDLPDDARGILQGLAQEELAHYHDDPAVWSFWWPRFSRLSDWFLEQESQWRTRAKPYKTEVNGAITFEESGFTLSARADRVDRMHGGAAIIDYKSGGTYSQSRIKSGDLPQLPAEALILARGGFEGVAPQLAALSYWTMGGGTTPGQVTEVTDGLEEIIEAAQEGLTNLIDIFGRQETPYYSLPRPDRAPRFNDYEHLARVKEWTALGETDTAEAA